MLREQIMLEDRLMMGDAISKTAKRIEPPVHVASPLSALLAKAVVQRHPPERRVVSRAKQGHPEGKLHLGDQIFSACGGRRLDLPENIMNRPRGISGQGSSSILKPVRPETQAHAVVDGVAQADLEALQGRVEAFGKPRISLIHRKRPAQVPSRFVEIPPQPRS